MDTDIETADSLLESGRLEEAAAIYERLCLDHPQEPKLWTNIAVCYTQLENHAKSITAARRALELTPDAARAKSNLAAAVINAAMGGPPLSGDERSELAREGIALCDELLSTAPDDAQVLYNKANGLSVLGRHQEAKRLLQGVVEMRPGWDEALINLGNALKSLGRGIEALEYYRRVLDRNPKHWNALVSMGEALVTSSTIRHVVEDANRYFRAALEIRPSFLRTWGWLAYTEVLLGHGSEAEEILRRILATDPSDEIAQRWLQRIQEASTARETTR